MRNTDRILASAVRILAAVSILAAVALGGTTGKIRGIIKDKRTGEPLIGANVRIDGTSMGASSDFDGNYNILNVPPGEYSLIASMVGYGQARITEVRVKIDLTTTIDIELSEAVIESQEVVVVAERPLVQKDLTATTAVIGRDELNVLPVTEFSQVLSLQAGFVAGSLRGGRSGEVAYWIDGVPVTDAFNGSQVVEVNKSLIQELQLVSGAFNAEYGQAMSGIVNIATREGGAKYSGGIGIYGGDYIPGDIDLFPTGSFDPTNIRNIEANVSGPLLGEDLTFFANVRSIYFNGYLNGFRRFQPWNISYTDSAQNFHLYRDADGKGDSSLVPMNWSRRNYGQIKLALRVSSMSRLTVNYFHDYSVAKAYSRAFVFNPDGIGSNHTTSNTVISQFTQTLSDDSYLTAGGSFFDKRYQYYLYEDPHDARYVHPKLVLTPDTYSAFTGGTDLGRSDRQTQTWLAKVDVTTQIDAMNMLKAGVEIRGHRITNESMQLQPIQSQSDINLATASPYIQTQILDVSSNSHDRYRRTPVEYSAYLQDKMEFSDVIVNIGVRYDYFDPRGFVLADPSDPSIHNPIKPGNRFNDLNGNGIQEAGETDKNLADRLAYWYRSTTPKEAWSPRLGVSFPLTATGIVHFSYGHFFQIPRFERLYENPDFKIGLGTGNQGVVGNADLLPEQTISGELGLQQQLTEDLSLDVTAYLRDIRNLTGTRGEEVVVFGGASKYSRYTNSDFGFVKGVVLTLNKRFAGGFNMSVDYTYQVARGSASDPQEARNAIAGGAQAEVQLSPLGWDQRHTLNSTVSYSNGPWGLSGIAQYGSGTPYTPRSSTDLSAILTNSQLKPSYFNVDARAHYEIDFGTFRAVTFARVFNLFNIRNEVGVFNDSGRAGFTSDLTTARASNPREYVNTLEDYYRIPTNYSEPRRVEFGINLEF